MKVLAALADSATVKELNFKRTVDTTKQQSETLSIKEIVPGPASVPKKKHAVTHFVVFDDGKIVVARKNGDISIGEEIIGHLNSDIVGLALLDQKTVLAFSASGESVAIRGSNSLQFSLREGLTAVVQDPTEFSRFASAGTEQLPDVFELSFDEKEKEVNLTSVWKGTQPPNDMLDLPERNLVTGLAFVEPNQLVSVTSHGKIRVFDLEQEDGQPAEMVQASKDSIKSVSADPSHPNTVIVGDSRSTVSRWSLNPAKLLGYYKGVSGSTRSISVRGQFLATGGLDRYVRVFDVQTRQPAGRVYVGDEVWAVSLRQTDLEEDSKELDEFWEDLDTKTKRRKIDTAKPKDSNDDDEDDDDEADEDESGEDDDDDDESGSDYDSGEEDSEQSDDGSFDGFDD